MRRQLTIALVAVAALAALFVLAPASGNVEERIERLVSPHATVLFAGDMMFDRSVRQYAGQNGGGDYLFDCIDPVLQSVDLAVANLEGPITAHPSVSINSAVGSGDNFTFTFPTSTATLLVRHHIGLVSLGNNHIENFGNAGVRSTIGYLDAAGVGHFGDPVTNNVFEATVGGVKVAFVGYNQFVEDPASAAQATASHVYEARQAGEVPIVFAHWGIEYQTAAPASEVALAHEFVDAGAAAVIGSHPHVVGQHETYKGVPIYYSLGNFIFDQYWDTAVTHGLLLELDVSSATTSVVREIPVVLTRDRKVCPAP